jgi:putative ABC transport system permease protein
MNELRFALRRLTARPAASLASVLTLGCAIGAAAAAWSVISAALLHPLPVRDPAQLVVVGQRITMGPLSGEMSDGVLYPRFQLIRDAGIFDDTAAQWSSPLNLNAEAGGHVASVSAEFVTSNLFSLLGVQVRFGRDFRGAEDSRGAALVAVLSDRYWRESFGGDPAVVGRRIRLAGKSATIIGVLQHGFRGIHLADDPDVFLPLQTIADVGSPFTNYLADPRHQSSPTAGVGIVGRLAASQSNEQALARLKALPSLRPREIDNLGLMTINTAALPPLARRSLPQFTLLLASTVGLLLLIGCAAVGTLLLIRTEARREEFAMCMALGASRWTLARGIGFEGFLLASAGGVLALPAASWLINGLRVFQLPGRVDVSRLDLAVGANIILVCAGGAVAATLIVTLLAILFGFTANVADALRSRSATRMTRRWPRTLLVSAQIAVALVLVAGAGLFARSLIAALQLNSSLDASRLLTTYVTLDVYGRSSPRDSVFFDDLFARLDRDPAIASVAYSVSHGSMLGELTVDGVKRQYPSPVTFDGIDEHFFRTLAVPLVEGRQFASTDKSGAPPVAIVSKSFARLTVPGATALGHRITMIEYEEGHAPDVVEIVGVVSDVVDNVNALSPLSVYRPLTQLRTGASRMVAVRPAGDVEAARRTMVSTIKALDPTLMPRAPMTLEEAILKQMHAQQFGVVVLGALATLAMLLTALGTYVLAESMASMRLRELGIRASLGATRAQLGLLVLRETGRMAGVGVLCGVVLAWLGAGTIRALLFQVQPLDPATLGAAAMLIFIVAALVSIRPALRAARVDLTQLLREE